MNDNSMDYARYRASRRVAVADPFPPRGEDGGAEVVMISARECRQQAGQYTRLVETASSGGVAASLSGIARSWQALGSQIERLELLEQREKPGSGPTR